MLRTWCKWSSPDCCQRICSLNLKHIYIVHLSLINYVDTIFGEIISITLW